MKNKIEWLIVTVIPGLLFGWMFATAIGGGL